VDTAPSPARPDTVAELRGLYRASEARAARLRLLVEAGRDLATATAATLDAVLAQSARRIALFVGCRDGEVTRDPRGDGIALVAPGPDGRRVGGLRLSDVARIDDVADREDREVLAMLAQLLAEAIDRVARDTERESLLAALRERERRLEYVVGRLFSAQEEERRRVSRELHDGVAQTATALFRQLDAAGDPRLAGIAREVVGELRAVIGGLRPTTLDDLGLRAAVSALAEALAAEGYDVAFEAEGPRRWPDVVETAFFRVAQEAFANVRKHAGGPCRVDVVLRGDADAGRWELRVRDRGRGTTPAELRRRAEADGERVGVAMMRERMAAIGGTLSVEACGDGGVAVAARVGPA